MLGQKGGHESTSFTKRDLSNHLDKERRQRVQNSDSVATLSYLQAKADNDHLYYFKFSKTDDGNMKDLFWCDEVSRLDYNAFRDVIVFDSTYRKNNLHEAMFNKNPKAVVKDGDLVLRQAIRVVFPNTTHRLCAWYIQQNFVEHVKDPDGLDDFNLFIYATITPKRFDEKWKLYIEKYGLIDDGWTKMMVVKEYRHNELRSDFKSIYTEPVITTSLCGIEHEAAKILTKKVFMKVKYEIHDALVNAMKHEDVNEFPTSLICSQWLKLAKADYVYSIPADDFVSFTEEIYKLISKIQKRHNPASTRNSTMFDVGYPTVVKTRGPLQKKQNAKKKRHCSNCKRVGHTIRKCPRLFDKNQVSNID
ncbi:protein FAR1-RELATED SEQUENCE 7-like [Lotus japonicus]|uniref:protein FAR1-RELATED SEQUENCE 7-like n=1 Tax=Lotus japonicus TaxID=34305 RepID=UPI00258791DE|nr:protein FAR1-RELATED SEQUENCE 7-like [Lotus japonicus]